MLGLFKQRRTRKRIAQQFYFNAARAGRTPAFYASYNVPDTIDGRFEMIGVHVALYINRLNALERPREAQKTFDVMFAIMEKAIREIGVGDLSVPKHMKRMMKGFKGRAMNYIQALNGNDAKALEEAVRRNVYATAESTDDKDVQAIAGYIKNAYEQMNDVAYEDLIDFQFPELVPETVKKKVSRG